MGMDRRRFLQVSAGALGAAAVGPTLLGGERADALSGLAAQRTVLDALPGDSGIDHVVVLMMENRSYDSYLGWLSRDRGYRARGKSRYGWRFFTRGRQHQAYPDANGVLHHTRHFTINAAGIDPYRGCGHPDPGHGWNAGRAQRDRGFVAAGSGNDDFALSYYRASDLPVYRELAYRFTICDRWHASLLGPTYPNREYLLSGQSGGNKTNYLPVAEGGFQWDSIYDRLGRAGVSVADYAADLPPALLFGPRVLPYVRSIDAYYEDCATGNLPQVSYVDPAFNGGNRSDDHPHGDIRAGQRFVRDAFAAFARSPHWERGLFVLVYDEWGGFFDHLAPPHLADDRASTTDAEDFSQAGFRVPAILASPRVRPGFASHRLYDHTSVLRFLEWRFLGAPAHGPGTAGDTWFFTERDRRAENLGRTLLLDVSDPEIGFDLDVAVDPPSASCDAAASGLAGEQRSAPVLEPDSVHPFATPEALEYFADVGFTL